MITGLALILVGRNIAGQMPPNVSQEADMDFLQLLQSMGKMIKIAGIVFEVVGVVMLVYGCFNIG